jgi:hypothetical protein
VKPSIVGIESGLESNRLVSSAATGSVSVGQLIFDSSTHTQDAELAPFEFVPLAALRLERLRHGDDANGPTGTFSNEDGPLPW